MGTHIFDTPYDANDPLNGKECVIQKTKPAVYRGEDATLLVILFDHGPYLEVWPEEIQPKEPEPCPSSPTSKPSASATN